jgi:hypothetical protein
VNYYRVLENDRRTYYEWLELIDQDKDLFNEILKDWLLKLQSNSKLQTEVSDLKSSSSGSSSDSESDSSSEDTSIVLDSDDFSSVESESESERDTSDSSNNSIDYE